MSYAQEPYAQFVDDLLTALTGGVAREQFVFDPDGGTYRLEPASPLLPSTVRIVGQHEGAFTAFERDRDWTLAVDDVVQWRARPDGTPAANALWPDGGTLFFVNYDVTPVAGAFPLLTDRNPGSVTRLLAESFAREFAVLSRQLEGVYESGFIDTATGRDLDQLVALVGVTRLTRSAAVGSVVFARSTPAAADITIEAGTRLSSAQPPAATFETSATCVLRRGTLSVEAPIRALVNGNDGVVAARAITVINRPIFGIDQAWNPQGTRLTGEDETDAALRARAKRALQFAGRATTGAMLGALANVPQVREKDVRVAEDPLASPGVVTVKVAVPLSQDDRNRAVELIEQTRPVGVRVQHNLDVDAGAGATVEVGANPDNDTSVEDADLLDASGETLVAAGKLFYPVAVKAVVVPASALLSATDRNDLKTRAIAAIQDTIAECGIGEAVIYNRLVERLMAIEGVLDVTLDLWANVENAVIPSHRNLIPPATLRPTVLESEGGMVAVDVGARLVALDLRVKIELKGAGLLGNVATNLEDARVQVAGQLRAEVDTVTSLSVAELMKLVVDSEFYAVTGLEFTMEYVDAGVRLHTTFTTASPAVAVSSLERLWVRTVRLLEDA